MHQDNSAHALGYDDMNEAQPLYVRSPDGHYSMANDSQVPAAARVAAASLIADGPLYNAPGRVKSFFQAKLCGLGHECMAVVYLDAQLKAIRYFGARARHVVAGKRLSARNRKNRTSFECGRADYVS